MKILFVAMMFVLSAGAQATSSAVAETMTQAGELDADGHPLGGGFSNWSPPGWKEMSPEEREAYRTEYRIREQERQATMPECKYIKFTGIATDPSDYYLIEKVIASRDIKGALAKNPFECRIIYGSGQFRVTAKCTGLAFLRDQKGSIQRWDKDHYFIYTTLKFESGQKLMVGLALRRKDAVCIKVDSS